MELKDWAFLILGVWGAGLSTYLAIRQVLRERRKIHIRYSLNGIYLRLDYMPSIVMHVTNTGHRPIEIHTAGLMTNSGRQYFDLLAIVKGGQDANLPVLLRDGEGAAFYFQLDKLHEALVSEEETRDFFKWAFVIDAEGNIYKRKLPKNELRVSGVVE